jgi:hypothetical protein
MSKKTKKSRKSHRTRRITPEPPPIIYRHGDKVEVVNSPYPNIVPGDTGVVKCQHLNGYGVTIEKFFPPIVSQVKGKVEKRVVFFLPREIKKVATLQS